VTESASEDFIPYLVFVRFDKDDRELKARLAESVPLLKAALMEVGEVQFVEMSYDGSAVVFLVAANPKFEDVLQVRRQLHLPQSRASSPLTEHDKILIVTLETGCASRLEYATSWLREYGLLVE
jgi:hypothetical protein